jgi:hypothetical protein
VPIESLTWLVQNALLAANLDSTDPDQILLAVLLTLAMVAVIAFAWEHTRAVLIPASLVERPYHVADACATAKRLCLPRHLL